MALRTPPPNAPTWKVPTLQTPLGDGRSASTRLQYPLLRALQIPCLPHRTADVTGHMSETFWGKVIAPLTLRAPPPAVSTWSALTSSEGQALHAAQTPPRDGSSALDKLQHLLRVLQTPCLPRHTEAGTGHVSETLWGAGIAAFGFAGTAAGCIHMERPDRQ